MRVIIAGTEKGDVKTRYTQGRLEDFQEFVGGYIETAAPVQLREHGIQMLVNEEGLLMGLQPNENLYPFFYVGPAVFVGVKDEYFVSLTLEQMDYIRAFLMGLGVEGV